jgi:hypothetical protein
MRARWLGGLAALIFVVGCKDLDDGAKEHFATSFSCPESRVEVRARPDLKWSKLLLGDRATPTPPAEVASDPERLAKWNEDQAKGNTGLDRLDVFEAKGCNHEQLMACFHPDTPDGHGTDTGRVACIDAPAKAP